MAKTKGWTRISKRKKKEDHFFGQNDGDENENEEDEGEILNRGDDSADELDELEEESGDSGKE